MQNDSATPELCPDAAAVSRRRFLASSALPAAAAVAFAATGAGHAAEPHPDEELLAAWRGYQQAYHEFDAACALLPDGGTEADHAPFWRRIDPLEDKIQRLPALSMAGVAIKLRYLFAAQLVTTDAHASAIYGEPVSPALAAEMDTGENMLWRLIEDLERLAGNNS